MMSPQSGSASKYHCGYLLDLFAAIFFEKRMATHGGGRETGPIHSDSRPMILPFMCSTNGTLRHHTKRWMRVLCRCIPRASVRSIVRYGNA